MKKLIPVFFICLLLGCFHLAAQDTLSVPKKLDAHGFSEVFVQIDRLYVSGQPDEESFSKLKNLGVATIINLRTKQEMDNRHYVPFDEKEVVQNLGMNYVHIPLGGKDTPYNKEALNKFVKTFENSDGKVLLHCSVAYRASHMWAAYLIEYKNYSPEVAVEHARAINFGELPIEGLLGKKAIYRFE